MEYDHGQRHMLPNVHYSIFHYRVEILLTAPVVTYHAYHDVTYYILQIKNRRVWRDAIEDGGYSKQCEELLWRGKQESSSPHSSQNSTENGYVHILPRSH